MSQAHDHWLNWNQQYLLTALAEVKHALQSHGNRSAVEQPAAAQYPADCGDGASAIETLCGLFGLSAFERAVLLTCAGAELDGSFAEVLAMAHGDARLTQPTFSLALAALPEAHWSALAPTAPLRYYHLIETTHGDALTTSPLRIDERVLHYLTGVQYVDESLLGFVEAVAVPNLLVESHRALADQIAVTWSRAAGRERLPVIQLCGADRSSQRAIAAKACSQLGLALFEMSSRGLPSDPRELQSLLRLWQRESVLSASALLAECHELDATDSAREWLVGQLVQGNRGALIVAGRARRTLCERETLTIDVAAPHPAEQREVWHSALSAAGSRLNGEVEALVSQFSLNSASIRAAAADVLGRADGDYDGLDRSLWDACRRQARPKLEDLAQRIEPAATWDDLVLPDAQRALCREIAIHVRHRMKVYEEWGLGKKSARGLGISALFAGPSGTGKTMAAEVLANELRLDLYHIDLSQVVSKYIGETEKNLRRVFDAAEQGGAILLFDEADALFGKRSEVKDSHDRYANIEVGYLLQRMESYRGLAILTTNMKGALDTAFLRRLRFVVQFPFPDAAQRCEIWRRIFPLETPTDKLDLTKLSRLNVSGGNIRNIAFYAAFLAADANQPIRMPHLLRAARVEYGKLEKPLTAAEIGDWS